MKIFHCLQNRGPFKAGAVAFALSVFSAGFVHAQEGAREPGEEGGPMMVTLLGTGSPAHSEKRRGFSNLVQAGGLNLVIDAGRAVVLSLGDMGIPVGKVDAAFITHYHSDHINGLPDLFATGYISAPVLGGRKTAFQLYGPEGIEQVASGLETLYGLDAQIRLVDERGTEEAATHIDAYKVEPGVVFDENGVKVTMFKVHHGDLIKPSVGYRVDYDGHSVVFASDTTYDPNVIENARGVDLLVHEAGIAAEEMKDNPIYKAILAHHTPVADAAKVFNEAGAKQVVLSHMVRLPGPRGIPTVEELVNGIRAGGYEGPLVAGEDLMQFVFGADGVEVTSVNR